MTRQSTRPIVRPAFSTRASATRCPDHTGFRKFIFSSSVVPGEWRLLYSLNPMVGVIDGFRWSILGGQSPLYLPGLAAGCCVAAFFLWFGIHRFRKTERSFADLI